MSDLKVVELTAKKPVVILGEVPVNKFFRLNDNSGMHYLRTIGGFVCINTAEVYPVSFENEYDVVELASNVKLEVTYG